MAAWVVARLRAAGCVFAEDEARVLICAAASRAELAAMVDRRAAGLPLEQVVGWAEFCGRRIAIDPGVFVPRKRTEFLVEQAVALASGSAAGRSMVVDLCCGSGAVGVAVAARARTVELHASDVDPAAVRCARRNVEPAGGTVYEGDLFEPLPRQLAGRVDLLLANVPYVPTDEVALLPAEARLHEPRVALDGGADGLEVLRRIATSAPGWLAPGGWLLAEVSDRQADAAIRIAATAGLTARVVTSPETAASVLVARYSHVDADVVKWSS